MEKKITVNKKIIGYIVALVAALCVIIGAFFGVSAYSVESGKTLTAGVVNASANGEGDRVTMLDLMGRYPIDYVIGPMGTNKTTDEDGNVHYVDASGNVLLDKNGEETNNTYGIPRKQYFNVENYIYTSGEKDSVAGRTLYGWKPDICAVDPSRENAINEDGTITYGAAAGNIGIYVAYGTDTSIRYGTTGRYALIVPKDITTVGQGSGAFVSTVGGVKTSYYARDFLTINSYTSGKEMQQFTDFASFITSTNISYAGEPYFWQPRERLAGIYFPDDSRLKEIQGGASGYNITAEDINRTTTDDIGKPAFVGLDNLRFLVLPGANASAGTTGLETIGTGAFYGCKKVVDFNIPSSVTSIGSKAFGKMNELLHITIPNITNASNVSTDAFYECNKLKSIVDIGGKFSGKFSGHISYVTTKDSNPNNVIYIFAGKPTKDDDGNLVNDTGLYGFILVRNGSSWSALGLAGATGEDDKRVFVFPSKEDFDNNSDRRLGVKYDYIDTNGEKRFSTLSNENVTEYDVAANFASDTWCKNVVMPKEIKKIGANAFNNSGVLYLETYATDIGTKAFAGDNNTRNNQWYYFHSEKPSNSTSYGYSVAQNAFIATSGTRHVVFDNRNMWNNVTVSAISTDTSTKVTSLPLGTTTQHYLIPIIANVENEDNEDVGIDTSDIDEYFYNDPDYVKNPVFKKGVSSSIIYTKRLSGATIRNGSTYYNFTHTKQFNGQWAVNTALSTAHESPTLSNMSQTVWYDSDTYSANTNAKTLFGNGTSNTDSPVDVTIYTKNIAKPANIADGSYDGVYRGDYTFGQMYTFGATQKTLGDDNAECIDYYTALGLSDDYVIDLTKFIYAGGTADGTSMTTSLHNAGSYSFNIQLNSKWGVWSQKYIEDNVEYFTASATIARKQLDFSDADKVPLFVNANNDTVLSGDRTPIYKYNDGWYIAQKDGETPNDTKTVTNSFLYYTGNEVSIKIQDEVVNADGTSVWQDVNITSRNGLSFANSSEYTASFMFQVKYIPDNNQYSNYIFYYGDDDETKYENVTDVEKGLSITSKQSNFFRISKRWYIVNQTNMFVNDGTQTPYLPIEGDVHYADDITVKVPALLYGNAAGTIEYAIDYVPITGGRASTIAERPTEGATQNAISYYINSSMPAGTYNLKLYGSKVDVNVDDEIKSYSAISGEYTITVLPKEFDSETVADIHNTMRGTQVANPSQAETELEKYINAYPLTNKKLHESVSDSITSLNSTLASDRSKGGNNYWTTHNEYFDTAVTVGYNREGSGNTVYMSEQAMLDSLATANTYTLYYSISAKNYATIGGADASDRQQRGFRTTLYTAIPLSEIYGIIVNVNDPYFKDVIYTGDTAQTRVPYSQYYKYSFDDTDYVNVGKRTVTLTLNDPVLARWESDGNDYSEYMAVVNNGKSLRVNFNIVTADNGWNVMPQMPSWTFNGFDAEVNAITAGLKFDSTVKYALIPNTVADPLAVEWGSTVNGVACFTVDENGIVDDATAAKLNALKPASYYLKFFVSEIYATDSETVNVNAYNDIARNNINVPMTTVTIGKAGNSWTSTPNVMRWTFGDYNPDVNTITAEAAYPALKPTYGENVDNSFEYTVTTTSDDTVTVSKVLPDVVFSIRLSGSNTAIVGLESFTAVTDDIAEILAGLHAGTYVLTTSMGGSDYYNAIAPTSLSFEIGKATNTWTTTPQVAQWTWGEYSAAKNVISAATKFSGADGTEGSTDAPILFSVLQVVDDTRVVVDKLANFQIDADGNIIDADAAVAFAALHAGDYYLRATKQGNNDYTEITGGDNTDIPFSVAKATAVWEITPTMTSWQYGSFVNDNFRGGEPKDTFINYEKPITYTIERVDGKNFEFAGQTGKIFEFLFNDEGLLDQSMYEAFALLHVGEYKIIAIQDETSAHDYTELKSEIEFAVLEATNSWSTAPSVIGWTYGSFSDAYFTAGVPTFDESMENGVAAQVKYTLTKAGDSNFKKEFTTLAGAGFATLDAGNYTLIASYAGTDDYREIISSNVYFTVSKYINGWNPSPSIRGWSYKNFTSALFIAGVPTKQESVGDVTYVLTGGNLGENGLTLTVTSGALAQNSVTALTGLEVGSYTLTVTYAGTVNYDAIVASVTFEVTKISNTWATRPSLLGWTYGSFSAAYFTAGVPTFNESIENGEAAKVKYTLTKNDDDSFKALTFTTLAQANLAALDAGNYTLKVSYAGTANYEALDADDTVITFAVSPVNNTWDTQPTITGFVYNQFTAANNFIAGVPHFPLSDKSVYYAIGKSAYTSVTTLEDFNGVAGTHFIITDDASIDAITAHLGGLGKGAYYFAVFVPADNNYSYLFYTGSFNVSQTSNYWENATPPDISGWTYGAFADSLFKSGTPIHGTATYTVRYVVDGNVDETDNGIVKIGDTSLSGLSYTALKGLLQSLNAGTYSLQASSGSTEDYAEVKASKQFTVAKANNAWQTTPNISGWKFDDTTKTPGNKGTARYENAEITAKYYLTTTDNNGNTVPDTSKGFSAVKDAGSYAYVLTVADTTNYNGFTTTLFFTVEKDDNHWATSPAGSYSWTWGDNITSLTANIINAEAHNGKVTFSIVKTDGNGTYTARSDMSIAELLETLPVGKYTITATVTPDDNHVSLTSAEAYIEVLTAHLTVTTEPACAGWTWGVADANKVFTDIAVTPAKESDIINKVYSLSIDGGKNWTSTDADYYYLLAYLRSDERNVGEYRVRIVVDCLNHESVTRTVTFTIGNASFVWSGEQKNVEWDWNGKWSESDGGRDIPNWTATDCQGKTVALVYTVNDTITYTDFSSLKNYLQSYERNAGTYTVKVIAELDNHETAEKTFAVTVNQAENEWTQILNGSYTIEYKSWDKEDWKYLPAPAAQFGTVVIKHGNTTIDDINVWIKKCGANTEPYVLMITVDEAVGQYTGLSKKVEITVVGIGSTWSNINDLPADTEFTYTKTYDLGVFEWIKNQNNVVFPIGSDQGTTKYTLYFNDTRIPAYNTLEGIMTYFSLSERTAGTYKIVADYEPTDKSYATLQYTVTINVAKAEVSWDERLESSYSLTYNSVNVPNPTVDKDFATVTVTVKKSGTDAALDMNGMQLAEFVKTLDVGTYTITATIAESDNYYVNGSRETTSVLYIGAIPNAWKDVEADGKKITATEWTDGYTWTFTRGDTISVMLPESVIGEITITFGGTPTSIKTLADLNELLSKDENGNSRAAGRYSLRFAVAATDNYNGLVSNCTVVINKKSNTWTQQLVSVNTSGSVNTATFTKPTAVVDKMAVNGKDVDLRLFNIVRAGNPANSDWYTYTTFMSELGMLVNGTYTITVRIGGGTPTNALDDFKKAMELYTADYEEISCSCTVSLSPAKNEWKTKLSNMNWTWGDPISVELSAATHGNSTIVYTISGNNKTITVKTSDYNDSQLVQKALNDELKALTPDTYTITASIAGTDLYAAPAESNFAILTVSKYVASWNGYTGEQLATYALLNMTWNQAAVNFLPELTVNYRDEYGRDTESKTNAVVWRIDNETLTEDVITALNKRLAGTYTITATYDGDNYNEGLTFTATVAIGKVQTAWVNSAELGDSTTLTWTFGKRTDSDKLPELAIANWSEGVIKYYLIGSSVKTEIGDWNVYLAGNVLGFGTYTFTAEVEGDANHTDKTFTAIVTVEKAVVVWSIDTVNADRQYNWVLKSEANKAITQPTLTNAGGCTVTYTLVKVGSTGTLYSGNAWSDTSSLSSVLATQKAGTYEITATVNGDEIYVLPADVTYTLTISAEPNKWTTKPDADITWIYKSDSNIEIEFVAEHNNDILVLIVGSDSPKAINLNALLESKSVGTYTIVASVPATEEYAGLDPYTVTLTIKQAPDSFGACNVPESWNWDDVSQKTDENGVAWQTNWNTAFSVPVPQVSEIATAVVYNGTAEQFVATLHYDTVDQVKKVLETDLNALKSKLLGLHVGTYTIEFVVADSANYKGCSVVKSFEVLKVDNLWDGANGAPDIAGWQYNSSVVNPTATPVFGKGTVKFSYAKAGSETIDQLKADDSIVEWQETTETAGGEYWLRATVPGTDDYNVLVGYCRFNINAAQNGWVNNPGVIAWNWDGYDKTVNLFSGSAKNNGTATFKIHVGVSGNNRNLALSDFVANGVTLDKSETWIISQFCTTGFTLVNDNNVMVVSDDVAKYLNALKPGTYLLTVNVAGDNNYGALNGSATFVVRQATNGWQENKAPAVSSYTYDNFGSSTYFTEGETAYGTKQAVTYKLDGTTYDGETVSETFVSSESKAAYVKLQERLATLDAGNYTLSAWVAASADGTYTALYSSGSPYTARAFTVARATNSWKNTQIVVQINKAYSEIHATGFDDTAFTALYAKLLHNNPDAAVNYALLNSDYTSRNTDSLTYAQLFDAVKALPAGEYVIRATVAQTNNYLAIAPTDTRLTISTHDNAFTQIPDALTAQWAHDNDKNNATVLTDFEVKATYGEDTVTYTLGTETYNTYDLFKAAVKTLNAGSYNVTITIAGTDEYTGLSAVRMLTVAPADNNWQNGWNVAGSLSVADVTTRAGLSWGWKSTVTWTRAVPIYGTTVHVEIRQRLATNEWYTVQYVTVDYSASNGDSAVATISEALSKLDVGNYEIIVSAPASGNWTEISNNTEFEVTKVANNWVNAPYLTGATGNKWVYGANVIPGAEAKHGVARYEYTTKSGDKLTSMPTEAGEYVIKFIVDKTNNYDGISDSLNVTIEKATNRGFSVALSANGWTWGAYDRETNLFKGTPEITDLENAQIKFSVGKGTGEDFAALPDLSMFELNANGLVERDSKVEAALRALTGGTSEQNNTTQYTLRIHVGETDNYVGFTFETTFNVAGATNTWTKTPSIVTWAVNNWTSESLPSAAALYGAPAITITGETDGVVYFKGAYKKVEGSDELELVVELNDLNLAPAGYYEMYTSVGTVSGQYNIPLTATSRFKIDVKGAGEANYWEEIPNIDGWVANIDGLFNLPSGKPIRGLPNFVFYVRNEDGTRGQQIDESLTKLVVKKGDKYEADIYIPVEPGSYILVASSNGNPAAEGKPDALKEEEIYFAIGKRPLSFEEELRISTLLYLGEREDWADPTLKASLDDAEITFTYTNKETGVSSTDMPTEAGIFTVTATISALYCESKSMSVDFTVKLSPNGWTAAPNIKDWSEENKGNLPTGAATVGSDQIVYTYASVKEPNKILKEKPKSEGSYIMYADLIVDGYEPLHAEYRFVIEPAFDRQLVIAAIVLTVIAAMLAAAVIYFAIRRYREN